MNTAEYYPSILSSLCLFREARGQSMEAKRAILHVILNRAARRFRGEDPVSVILWPAQFSSFTRGDPNASLLPDPNRPVDWQAWLECCGAVDDPGDDPTEGAVMYHSYEPSDVRWPSWAVPEKQTARIGPFWFYRA